MCLRSEAMAVWGLPFMTSRGGRGYGKADEGNRGYVNVTFTGGSRYFLGGPTWKPPSVTKTDENTELPC